jgi:hypothetical protein
MKKTKLTLVTAILAIVTLGFAQSESGPAYSEAAPAESAVEIDFQAALLIPNLVQAMHEQLTPSFLQYEQPTYTVVVRLQKKVYYINGTYKQWEWFFTIGSSETPHGI